MNTVITEKGFSQKDIERLGNSFMTGNGYLGYRGTLDEYTSADLVAVNVAGLYDGVVGKWRETVNAFNPLYLAASYKNYPLTVRADSVISHEINLDISCGVFSRRTVFAIDCGRIELYSERFVSQKDKNLICSRTVLKSDKDARLILKVGVDPEVWDLNGPHLKEIKCESSVGAICVRARTQESNLPVCVICNYSAPFKKYYGGFAEIEVNLRGGKPYVLDRVAGVYCGEQCGSAQIDYDLHYAANKAEWKRLWEYSGVKISGDDRAHTALGYSIYQLLILAPKGNYSIAARGLSGQTYKGAVFWDTEIFMLPFYLATDPDTAKRLVKYRIDTLPQAREKAACYGYDGAFYAWESQDGFDACTDFNVTDVFTHRPVRTYFKDKQIHISADVGYALISYYSHTADDRLMLGGGLDTIIECARFFRSYSYYNHIKGRYELLDVIGPDEYHERVNNNAYTNYMAHFVASGAVALCGELEKIYPEAVGGILGKLPANTIEDLKEWSDKLYLPQPDEDGIIEQFDGYFGLEDADVEAVKSRLVHPNEYWGGSGGVATATRVIKQADVIMLFNLLPDLFPIEIQRKNYLFYLPYTEHGSSLSHCAYALTACRIGESGGAYEAFINSAEIDLRGGGKQWAGEIYIGGTHPAASGGAWLTAVHGFAGLSFDNGRMKFSPIDVEGISSISFTAVEGGERYRITVEGKNVLKEKLK